MSPTGLSRRAFITRSAQFAGAAGFSSLGGATLAACGSSSSSTASTAANVSATPGLTIPTAHVNFTTAPAGNDGIPVIGMLLGYFSDVGITIGPTKTGAEFVLGMSLAPLLSGEVDAGSIPFEVPLQELDTVQNLKLFSVVDVFVGNGFFAPPGSSALGLTQYIAKGLSFPAAMAATVGQMKGERIAVTNDVENQAFWEYILAFGGIAPSSAQRLDNSTMLELLLAGRIDFAGLAGGTQYLQAVQGHCKPILLKKDMVTVSTDQAKLALFVNHQAFVTTSGFYDANYDTMLRFASAIYRVLDDLTGSPASRMAALSVQAPYLSARTGTTVTVPILNEFFGQLSLIRPFEQQAAFYGGSDVTDVYWSGQDILDNLYATHTLKQRHTVAEVDGSKKIWSDLTALRQQSDALFARVGNGKSAKDQQVIAAARQHYTHRNYLDAVRFLRSVAV
jgi:ABC-type nitrate/sulfonate/bicarbonate transport system substrate-binding protein